MPNNIDIQQLEKRVKAQAAKRAAKDKEAQIIREQQEGAVWEAAYAERVKEYRAMIKKVGLTERLVVDDNLDISVSITEEEARVDGEVFEFNVWNSVLTKTMTFWEYESIIGKVNSLFLAQTHHKQFLADVSDFKKSMTPHQLRMITYFSWVL